MQEITIRNWVHFQEILNMMSRQSDPKWLFRGHRESRFKLKSTLYRAKGNVLVTEYVESVEGILCELNSMRNSKYAIHNDYIPDAAYPFVLFGGGNEKKLYDNLATLIYLRHHGFPSPFLDWTQSPYIAAYFALNGYLYNSDGVIHNSEAAIYCSQRNPESIALWGGDLNYYSIWHQIPMATERHFLQQTEYTYAAGTDNGNNFYFGRQEDAANNGKENQLKKLLLPVEGLLNEFMEQLNFMNINSYSLFRTEDALVQCLFEKNIIKVLSDGEC